MTGDYFRWLTQNMTNRRTRWTDDNAKNRWKEGAENSSLTLVFRNAFWWRPNWGFNCGLLRADDDELNKTNILILLQNCLHSEDKDTHTLPHLFVMVTKRPRPCHECSWLLLNYFNESDGQIALCVMICYGCWEVELRKIYYYTY